MKKLLFSALAILPFAAFAQKPFNINGDVKNLKSGDKVFLSYRIDGKAIVDSVNVTDGKFAFKGTLASPVKADVSLNKLFNPRARGPIVDKLSFYIEPASIKLAAADSLKNATVTGSATNNDDLKLIALSKPFNDEMNAVNSEYTKLSADEKKAQQPAFAARYNEAQAKLKQAQMNFAKSNPKSFVSVGLLKQLSTDDKYFVESEKVYTAMSADLKSSTAGLDLGKTIETMKKTAIGAYAMDFTQNDVNDKPVKLSDFKGQYVLLDFWASWCGPCRGENPNVVKAYNAYKDKKFTVLGVSLDQPGKKEAWLEAIAKDGLTWTHVSDLKFWNNEVSKMYGIHAIPANFLIDPNGKIIAKNIRGEALQAKLAEILGNKAK
jgi:peroxiredoxin